MNNWSYSHGILFGFAIPYYHFGIRTSMPVTKVWTAGFQLVNGWNNVTDNNGGVTVGLTSSVVKPKFTWNLNYYTGPETTTTTSQTGLSQPDRHHSAADAHREVQLVYQLRLRPEQHAEVHRATTAMGSAQLPGRCLPTWQGIATSARGQVTRNAALVGRYEYFFADQGYATW